MRATKRLFLALLISPAIAEDLFIGETYKIVEPNPIIEIKNKLVKDKAKLQAKAEQYRKESIDKLENLQNDFVVDLPAAKKDHVWKIDTSFILEYDIPDGKGGYLYQKGYKFDPKDYMKLSKNIVILNGDDPEQMEWAKDNEIFQNRNFKILLTGGKIVQIMREVHTPLYFYTKEVHQRFKLKHTPTIVRQESDNYLYAYEFKIEKE